MVSKIRKDKMRTYFKNKKRRMGLDMTKKQEEKNGIGYDKKNKEEIYGKRKAASAVDSETVFKKVCVCGV